MAETEEKRYLINVESNLDEYVKDLQKTNKEVEKFKEAQKEAEKQSGKNSKEYIEATAQLKVAQKEQSQATATLTKMTAAQKTNGNSYNDLYKQWDAAQLKLKSLKNTMVQNADGTIQLTEEYKQAAIEVANAKNALNNFTTGVKDGRNNVGLYGDAIKDAFGGLGGQLSSIVPGFDKLQQGLQTAKLGFTSLKGAIMATGIGALVLALMGLFQYFTKTKDGANFLSKATAALGAAFDVLMAVVKPLGAWLVSVFTEPKKALKELGDFLLNQVIVRFNGFGKIVKGIWETMSGDVSKGLKMIGDGASEAATGVENFRGKIEALGRAALDAAKAAADLAQAQADLAQKNVDASYTLAKLSADYEKYRAIADDDTRSLSERENAMRKAESTNRQMMATRVSLARQGYSLAKRELDQQKANGKDTIEIQQKAADSYASLKEAESAYNTSVIESQAVRRMIESDTLELSLDGIEKGLDGIKAANVSAINDDRKTVAERRVTLEALTQSRDNALAKEIKLIEEFSGKAIDLADLVATKDIVALEKKTKALDLSEKATIRLQDIVKNAQDTNTEFADLQKALDDKAIARKIAFTAKEKEIIDSIVNTNKEALNKTAIATIETTSLTQSTVARQTIKNADELSLELQTIEMTKQQSLRYIQLQQQLETDTALEAQRNAKTVEDITNMQIEKDQRDQLLLDAEAQNLANINAIQMQYGDQKKANAAQTEADITANQKLQVDLRKKALQGTLQVASDVFGQLSELAGKQTAVGKALAITQAIINTYQSATAAYASAAAVPVVGYVLGPIAAAAAIATGLKNVAEIRKASPSSGSGGGSASSGRTVSASFTAANQNIATSQVQSSRSDRLGGIQQTANNQAVAINTAQQPIRVESVISVEAFQSQAEKKNQVEVKSNI